MKVYLPYNELKALPNFIKRDEAVPFKRIGDLLEHLRRQTGSEPCILIVNNSIENDVLTHILFCFPEITAIPMKELLYTFVVLQIRIIRISPMFSVRTDRLLYIECCRRKLYFHFPDYCRSINHSAKSLPDMKQYGIIRCHTSFFVNLSCIAEISVRDILLQTGEIIPISHKYYGQIKKYRKKPLC